MEVSLRECDVTGVEKIRELAVRVWNQHYPSIISRAQIDYMLDLMYSPARLREQITVKGHRFFFIEAGGERCGFISWQSEPGDSCFIHKFYIDQARASEGIGSAAFRKLRELTGARTFRLTVNRQNYKAINFYFKNGFVIERVADFDIGNGFVMNDFVMVHEQPG